MRPNVSLLLTLALAGSPAALSAQSAWTGWYLGVNAGYGTGKSDVTSTISDPSLSYFPSQDLPAAVSASGSDSVKPKGAIGGITFGYNTQSGNTVYGFEVDADASGLKGDRSVTTPYPGYPFLSYTVAQSTKATYLATFRGRIGYASGRNLWFGTAGLAVTSLKLEDAFSDTQGPAAESQSKSKSKAGWTLGGGYEFDMQNQWSFKVELLYADFGKVDVAGGPFTDGGTPNPNVTYSHSANLKTEMLRFGFNYRF